jgi:hypothetical protein
MPADRASTGLKFVATDYAAFSLDGCGSYSVSRVIDEWVAEAARRCDLRDGLTAHVNEVVGDVYRALDARKEG